MKFLDFVNASKFGRYVDINSIASGGRIVKSALVHCCLSLLRFGWSLLFIVAVLCCLLLDDRVFIFV